MSAERPSNVQSILGLLFLGVVSILLTGGLVSFIELMEAGQARRDQRWVDETIQLHVAGVHSRCEHPEAPLDSEVPDAQ